MEIARACAANCFFAFLLFNAAASGLGAEAERSVTPAGEKRPDNNPNMETKKIGLVIHGGAGTIERSSMTPENEREYRAGLERALTAGYEILKRGGSSLDATEAAVRVLEDDPHFNAGRGSVFTSAGTNEMDASIMDGKTLRAGAVGSVQHIKNPIDLARVALLLQLDVSALMGYTGAVFQQWLGGGPGMLVAACALLLWIAAPLWFGLRAFRAKDF